MTDPVVASVAEQRKALHDGYVGKPQILPNRDVIGAAGEKAFADRYGLPMDTTARPHGDGGRDFTGPIGRIDVKTSPTPGNIIVRTCDGHKLAEAVVLAKFIPESQTAVLLGWATRAEVLSGSVRDFGYNGPCYAYPRHKLRPMPATIEGFTA